MLRSQDFSCFGIQVEAAPKNLLHDSPLDPKLLLVKTCELTTCECPSVYGTAENDVVLFGCKVNVFIVLLFKLNLTSIVDLVNRRFFGSGCSRYTFVHAFSPVQVLLHPFALQEASEDCVDLFQ